MKNILFLGTLVASVCDCLLPKDARRAAKMISSKNFASRPKKVSVFFYRETIAVRRGSQKDGICSCRQLSDIIGSSSKPFRLFEISGYTVEKRTVASITLTTNFLCTLNCVFTSGLRVKFSL